MRYVRWLATSALGCITVAYAQSDGLTNPAFEAGDKAPLGWTLPQGKGLWLKTDGLGGSACVRVDGSGEDSNAWLSEPVSFLPGRTYRLSFYARSDGASGGTAVCGPAFANVDIGVPGKVWSRYENVFVTPFRKDDLAAPLRLGQWQLKGGLLFDEVRLDAVEPVYATAEGIVLGAGEMIAGNVYSFDAPLAGESRNHSRPLMGFTAMFNSDRWCFNETSAVTYRHALAGRRLESGRVEVACNYYVAGKVMVDVSSDAKEWQHVGALTNTGSVAFELPQAMFPAESVYVRLRGARPPCTMQVHGYSFQGRIEGEPLTREGCTRYVETTVKNPKVRVRVLGLGDAVPGGDNTAELQVQNLTRAALPTEARVLFARLGSPTITNSVAVTLPDGGAFDLRIPYEVPGTGCWEMTVELGDAYAAKSTVYISDYYNTTYGEVIPVNHPKLNLWRASSGWKIPQNRALPRPIAKSLVLRVAKNEWEALQLVVTPNVALSNVMVHATALAFGKNMIPAENIEVLRVGYVPVLKTTDATGTRANWPDPLPPQSVPVSVGAGYNQPFWIRVKAPKDAPAGIYRGTVTVEADGVKVSAVLNVEVYGFALPDTLSCETAFGFNPGMVWKYQAITAPDQRRQVLDRYLGSLAAHRLSPYNPAPMDPWHVSWNGLNRWSGGILVTNEKASGCGSYFVSDASERENVHASYEKIVTLPTKGFKISFKHKTSKPQSFLFSLNYQQADGRWMSGSNTDLPIEGKPEWQTYETVFSAFPKGAVSCRFSLWAAGYQEPGIATGNLWVDDLSVTDLTSGKPAVEGGTFEPIDAAKVEPVFDWSSWDMAMARAFETYHFSSFVIHVDGLGGGTFQERYEPSFLGYTENMPEYDILLGKYLRGIEAHLREKKWLEKAYVYWFDEPDPKDYAFVMNGFAKLKKHAPGLRRMLTEQVENALVDGPNLWVPLTPSLNVEGTEARRKAGDQFWWYVCCAPKAPYATEFIDHPGTEMRVWLWQAWAERVTGVLIWETVYWTSDTAYPDKADPQNPYRDAMSWVCDGKLAAGTKNPWGNGDGRLMYPPEAAADGRMTVPVLDGPVDTIRMEMLRDGLEDYEYFVILKRLLTEKLAKLDVRERANVERLLVVPADVSATLTGFTQDPATIEAHRDRLARAIVDLQKR